MGSSGGAAARILVVDDSKTTRMALRLMLSADEYECLEATDGAEAVSLLEKEEVDLVLTDLHMPNMDGYALLRAVRALPHHRFTPVLVLTTESHREAIDDLRRVGATGVLEKPIERGALRHALKTFLGGG